MDPRYSRRLAAVAIFTSFLFITTWLDGHLSVESYTLVGKTRVSQNLKYLKCLFYFELIAYTIRSPILIWTLNDFSRKEAQLNP